MVWSIKSNYGASLVEVLVTVTVAAVILVPLYNLLMTGVKLVYEDKKRLTALTLANEQLELIRNLPYDQVGTSGGIPSGALAQTSTATVNNITYTLTTDITYVDDSYDKLIPKDLLNTDYKKVELTASWDTTFAPIYLTTTVAPNGIETSNNGGTLWLEVYDPTTDPSTPIKGATVTISAPTTTPPVALTKKTDSAGRFILPGAPPGVEAYNVTITKSGYSSAQTYATDPVNNPNPSPAPLNVLVDEVTTQYFEISPVVTSLTISTLDLDTSTPISTSLLVHGAKTIGTNGEGEAIYKYNKTITTDTSGNYQETNLETDTYSITLDPTVPYVMAGITPLVPFTALPSTTNTITFYLVPTVSYSALITVLDAAETVLPNANVHLTNTLTGFDQTQLTTSYGQTFFNNMLFGTYAIEISLDGYITYTGNLTINGNMDEHYSLAQNF